MGSDKIFMFDNPASSGSNGIMSLIPTLLQNKGLDPNMVTALMSNKNNQDAWGGAGCWWIWIILLFFLWGGWGGNGFGNNNGGGGGMNGLPAQLNNDAGRELLMNAIQGNGNAISQLASSLNCSTQQLQTAICGIQGQIQQIGNQVGMSSQQIINAVQNQSCEIGRQIADCCCTTNNNITKMGYENQLSVCNQTNSLVNTMNQNTLALRDGGAANTQAILSKLDAMQNQNLLDKIDKLREEKSTLLGQISNDAQTRAIQAYQAQTVAPLGAALSDLSARLAKIECGLPATVSVPYPNLAVYNPEIARAAAFGAYAGDMAAARTGCGC